MSEGHLPGYVPKDRAVSSTERVGQEMELFEPLAKVNVDPDTNPSTWNTAKVGEWLGGMGLGAHAAAFSGQRITGDVLSNLREHHLIEMGVNIIGERVSLMSAIAKLHHSSVNRSRFRVIWEGEEHLFRNGPLGYAKDVLLCVPWCIDPNHYKLTGSTLVVIERDTKRFNSVCCSVSRTTRNINLDGIAGVTGAYSSTCCDCGCVADQIHVELNSELGLAPVNPLQVKKGTAEEIVKMMQSAIEDAQAMVRHAPDGQQMSRA